MAHYDSVIAIDGPSGSGKSSVAKLVAAKLGLIYIDTGAMFRSVAYASQTLSVDFTQANLSKDEEITVKQFFHDHHFEYAPQEGVLVQLDNLNLTDHLRDNEISFRASQVSKHQVVRDYVAHWQKQVVAGNRAVLDGRDIGTIIFPQALVKVFVTATSEERAKRRHLELTQRAEKVSFEEVLKGIELRDDQDRNRSIAPLRKAQDALEIDSTKLTMEEVVEKIIILWKEKLPLLES